MRESARVPFVGNPLVSILATKHRRPRRDVSCPTAPHSIASRASSRLATNPSPPALAETRGALWWAIALHRARGSLPFRPPRRSFASTLWAGLLLALLVPAVLDNITGMFEVDDWRGKRYGRRME